MSIQNAFLEYPEQQQQYYLNPTTTATTSSSNLHFGEYNFDDILKNARTNRIPKRQPLQKHEAYENRCFNEPVHHPYSRNYIEARRPSNVYWNSRGDNYQRQQFDRNFMSRCQHETPPLSPDFTNPLSTQPTSNAYYPLPYPSYTVKNDYHGIMRSPIVKRPFESAIDDIFRSKGIDLSAGFKIGAGRYSKVITGKIISTNTFVAIKIINKNIIPEDFEKSFLPREIRLWKEISHRYLVKLLAVNEYDNRVLLVSEFGEMGNLLSCVQKNGPLKEEVVLCWSSQLLLAIDYLHTKRIAHRDIKLENIIIFNKSTVKLTDFGFARSMNDCDLSKTYCGSKSYSAPEILSGKPYDPFKSDIWSLGVVNFVMLTNRMPFSENMSNDKIVDHQRSRAYSWPDRLSRTTKETVDQLMTFDATYRPTSAQCFHLNWYADYLNRLQTYNKQKHHRKHHKSYEHYYP